jgi:hypothetical protein
VRVALAYYTEYGEGIDAQIREAQELRRRWKAEQALLG